LKMMLLLLMKCFLHQPGLVQKNLKYRKKEFN
jgi:hypothetical protein